MFLDGLGNEQGRLLQPETDERIRKWALFSSPIANSSAVFRASAARWAGFYDESLRQFADWEFWLRLGCQGKLYNFPEFLSYYTRWRGNSSSTNVRENGNAALSIVRRFKGRYPRYRLAMLYAYLYPMRGGRLFSVRERVSAVYSRLSAEKKASPR